MRKQSETSGKIASANKNLPKNPVDDGGEVDLTKSFMTKNPSSAFPKDASDEVVGTLELTPDTVAAPEGAPATEEPKVDSQGEPIAPTAPEAPAAEPIAPTVPEIPTGEIKPVAVADKPAAAPVAAAPVEAVKPSYAPDEKIHLVDGSDPWTREQVVAALHERATLQPRAQEADQFRQLFQFEDYAKAEKEWKPILEILRTEPEKTKFLDTAIHADAETLAYLNDSLAYYREQKAAQGGEPAAATPARAAQPTPAQTLDPRVDEALKFIERQKAQAGIDRANREWNEVFERYSFFRDDQKALEGLKATANVLYNLDRKEGKDDLECRGLLDALEMNRAIYDSMKIARNAAAPAAPASATVDPNREPAALLGGQGPAPSGAVRQPKTKDYTGNPDEAVAAFLAEHPGK